MIMWELVFCAAVAVSPAHVLECKPTIVSRFNEEVSCYRSLVVIRDQFAPKDAMYLCRPVTTKNGDESKI
jgi:hypothetical protein